MVRRWQYREPVAHTRLYRDGELVLEDFPAEDISEHLRDERACVWLDYCDPTEADLATIAAELQLHPLAVEDAVNEHQRPKLDRYDTHLFLSAYAVKLDTGSGELRTQRNRRLHHSARARDGAQGRRTRHRLACSLAGTTRTNSPSTACRSCCGACSTTSSTGTSKRCSHSTREIEALEDLLFDDAPREAEVQRRSFELRKSLVLLRRVVLPMREVVNSLMRRDLHVLDAAMAPYYQDVYDHVLRATEWTESLRDLVTTILETNLTIQGNRMNLVMKKVTSWAAIIAVPTAITGFYGQNVPYPGFAAHWGFWVSSALIVAASGALYVGFRRRDWL